MSAVERWAKPDDVPAHPGITVPVLAGSIVTLLLLAGAGGWASLAPLSSAAVAEGVVRVQTHRKTVQHLEGGIVSEILVREGQEVAAGQVLMRLDATQTGTTLAVLRDQMDALLGLSARLVAERDQSDAISVPAELDARRSEPKVASIIEGQERIFRSRRNSISGQLGILAQRVEQLGAEIQGYKAQLSSSNDQIRLIREEVDSVADLVERGLERKPRLLALQRQQSYLEGLRGAQLGSIAKAEQAIGEAKLQSADIVNKRSDEIALELRDTESRLLELKEKLDLATDINRRMEVTAPVAGEVVALKVHTSGGVVRPGEDLLDIVPESDSLIIEARLRPADIDSVHVGQSAQIALTAYKQRTTPRLDGTLVTLSADALADQERHQTYYSAEIRIDPVELSKVAAVRLYPGMPAEVLIVTGERTLLQYLVQPIADSFHRAFREQ